MILLKNITKMNIPEKNLSKNNKKGRVKFCIIFEIRVNIV